MSIKINSPMASGNGAYLVHKMLEKSICNYELRAYPPRYTYFPPLLYQYRRSNVDLVHTAPDYAPFFYVRGVPMIITFHGYSLDHELIKYNTLLQNIHYKTDLKWFTKKALTLADYVTSVSKYTAQLVKQDMKFDGDIRVIYNGIDEQIFRPVKNRLVSNKVKVLFSGNLKKRKGIDVLERISPLLNKNIEIWCTVGLMQKKHALAGENIINVGSIPHTSMPELYQSCDILLLPSVREGLSLAALEAMASGLPVVASDNSSFSELFEDGKGGYLCSVGNEQEFADALNGLAENIKLREVMGEYNRARVEQYFTRNRMTEEYKSLFEEVMDR